MRTLARTLKPQTGLVVGGAMLWGLMEFVALQRSQLRARGRRMRRLALPGRARA